MPRRTPLLRALLAAASILALAFATQTVVQSASAAPPSFVVRPGTNQLEVLDAPTGTDLELIRNGVPVDTGTVDVGGDPGDADGTGSFEWRQLPVGTYGVQVAGQPATLVGGNKVTSMHAPAPDQSFYDAQTLTEGFNFIETRDHTTLSANVVLPSAGTYGPGPYPTVVEYSGYDPSNPGNTGFAQIFTTLGFAYVGVNIRGTGCSGGSYLPFEPVQSLDGYDAIEAVAAQPWVKFHKVGMVGISYPGIEQLYVGRTQPPHLSAISPLSVIDDTYRGTLWPGGILNTGFATPWATDRAHDAAPFGEGWETDTTGKTPEQLATCAANQDVRLQNPDPVSTIEDNPFYNKTYYQQIDPSRFVGKINVPVYLAGAWQDEQTGGHFPDFLNKFRSSPHLFATMSNGSHTESLSLGEFNRYADFLLLYVARTPPTTFFKGIVGLNLAQQLTGMTNLHAVPDDSYAGLNLRQSLKKYNSTPPVRIIFEEGAAAGEPSGAPVGRFEHSFTSWPIPSAEVTRWFLTPHGKLAGHAVRHGVKKAKARSFSADPTALPATDYTGSSSAIWGPHPSYSWKQIPKGKGLGWITSPLKKKLVVIGSGSLNVWVKTTSKDVDLEATVTDVRPNGTEVFVQSGELRASHRKLIPGRSSATRPVHTDLETDAKAMPKGKYRRLRIEILPFAQAFRPGDRLRITLDPPGGSRPLWAFDTLDHGQRVTIATDKRHRSSLALSMVPGVRIPATAPPCRSLRSQPCRAYAG
jgi:predicted acyl esterase